MQGNNTETAATTTDAGQPRHERIRVLVVDDSRFTSGLLKAALEQHPQLEVSCSRPTTDDVTAAVAALTPHIVLVNDGLGRSPEGMKTLRTLLMASASIRSIIVLDDGEQNRVLESFRAGVKGVFRRSQPVSQLVRCIQAVAEGQVWASSADLSLVLQAFVSARPLQCVNANGEDLLSAREKQVLDSIAEGLSNHEIAERLQISEHTVKNHLYKMYEKLGVSTRVELILFASTSTASVGHGLPQSSPAARRAT
jgi:DNA-binding NarL/FixJ family response regulator